MKIKLLRNYVNVVIVMMSIITVASCGGDDSDENDFGLSQQNNKGQSITGNCIYRVVYDSKMYDSNPIGSERYTSEYSIEYDDKMRVITVTKTHKTTYTDNSVRYDTRLYKFEYLNGNTISYQEILNGKLVTSKFYSTDSNGNIADNCTYDDGMLTKNGPSNKYTTYLYDPQGNLIQMTHHEGKEWYVSFQAAYSSNKNNANIDLNAILKDDVIRLAGLYGKRSPNIMSRWGTPQEIINNRYKYASVNEVDQQGRIRSLRGNYYTGWRIYYR